MLSSSAHMNNKIHQSMILFTVLWGVKFGVLVTKLWRDVKFLHPDLELAYHN
jgi:hypothetical protein